MDIFDAPEDGTSAAIEERVCGRPKGAAPWATAFERDWRIMQMGRGREAEEGMETGETAQGIVVTDRQAERACPAEGPRISVFIWGGKVKPTPTLPYGRWKGAA